MFWLSFSFIPVIAMWYLTISCWIKLQMVCTFWVWCVACILFWTIAENSRSCCFHSSTGAVLSHGGNVRCTYILQRPYSNLQCGRGKLQPYVFHCKIARCQPIFGENKFQNFVINFARLLPNYSALFPANFCLNRSRFSYFMNKRVDSPVEMHTARAEIKICSTSDRLIWYLAK